MPYQSSPPASSSYGNGSPRYHQSRETAQRPEEVHVGIDFGTSSAKVSHRKKPVQGESRTASQSKLTEISEIYFPQHRNANYVPAEVALSQTSLADGTTELKLVFGWDVRRCLQHGTTKDKDRMKLLKLAALDPNGPEWTLLAKQINELPEAIRVAACGAAGTQEEMTPLTLMKLFLQSLWEHIVEQLGGQYGLNITYKVAIAVPAQGGAEACDRIVNAMTTAIKMVTKSSGRPNVLVSGVLPVSEPICASQRLIYSEATTAISGPRSCPLAGVTIIVDGGCGTIDCEAYRTISCGLYDCEIHRVSTHAPQLRVEGLVEGKSKFQKKLV